MVSTPSGVLTIECNNANISGSPFAVTIIPGPYSLIDSTFIEWNGNGVSPCIVNTICSVQITLRDSNLNLVMVPNLLNNIDVDTTLRGPFYSYRSLPETFYISNLNNSLSS